jgi:hypothetical protein
MKASSDGHPALAREIPLTATCHTLRQPAQTEREPLASDDPCETLLRGTQIRVRLLSTNYQHIISIEPGKRAIRHMRIAVADVLGWLAAGQSHQQILDDFLN